MKDSVFKLESGERKKKKKKKDFQLFKDRKILMWRNEGRKKKNVEHSEKFGKVAKMPIYQNPKQKP